MDGINIGAMTKTTRRNGQLMSCEPCRRSKQRCDHGRPHCSRCRKRGQVAEAQCHHHPAPMTRGARPPTAQLVARPLSELTGRSTSMQHTHPLSAYGQQDSLDRGTGLVGMDNVLPPLLELPSYEPSLVPPYPAITRTTVVSPIFSATSALLAEGISVLGIIRDSPVALGPAIQLWYTEQAGSPCQGPLIKASWEAVQKVLLPDLRADSSPPAMLLLCDNTFKCTSQPPRWPFSPANRALEQTLSADGVRWEVVGLYCALSGVVIALMREEPDGICLISEMWGPDRKRAMERTLDTCIRCYNICERMGQINDLTMWLLIMATMLSTWCFGDDSFQAWRLMGDLNSVISALGFYRTAQQEPLLPEYLQELRKRAIASAHELDKGLATFVGRPPRLNRHYLDLALPLDLPDSIVVGTPEAFKIATAELDDDGWNAHGPVHSTTRIRAVSLLLVIREEALELSLGSQVIDIASLSRELLSKSAATWASLPPHVKYKPALWATMPPKAVMMLLSLRLESLYTDFILHKLIVYQEHGDRSTLIETAHLILSLVLSVLSQRIVFSRYRIDLEWSVVYYAMPCASVLILEILRQTEQPQQPNVISRSTLIQDLSVLISCCDWLTEPGQQNYALCKRAQAIFSRSLDHILNPSAAQLAAVLAGHEPHHQEDAVIPENATQDNMQMLIETPEWMSWLETCDLQASPWLDILDETAQG